MAKFNSITFNCNGLNNKNKRKKVFTYLKEKLDGGFCFLQETHSTEADEDVWKKQWGDDIHFSHGTSNSTGCAVAFSNKFPYSIIKESKDTQGRFLILEINVNDDKLLLINLYNANTENDQIETLNSLASKLNDHNLDGDCKCVFGGDFNLYFDTVLDCSGGNPSLKKRSISVLTKILDKLDVCDIFRVRFPSLKQYTYHRKNPRLLRRLDYFFTSNSFQEYINCIKILPSYMSDHSPILISVNLDSNVKRGNYGWKFNNSLLKDNDFSTQIREHFEIVKSDLTSLENPHLRWEYFKYQARKFSIKYSKSKIKAENEIKIRHECVIKKYTSTKNRPTDAEYAESKEFLDKYIERKTEGAILRSKSLYYEQNEKSSKYFLNLERLHSENNTVKKVVVENGETSDSKEILNELHKFYSTLFKRRVSKTERECKAFLDSIHLPSLSDEQKLLCDKPITIDDLYQSLSSMSNGKSPGNDGFSVEFFKFFWEDIKDLLFASYQYSKSVGELSVSQRQAVIKLIEKRDKDKRYIENWRPISLLNVDTKILSKCVASRFIPVLPSLISPDQTAYVKGRYIGESIRLISDILDSTSKYKIPGYILTVDLKKAFDSIDHVFLSSCLKKFGFGDYFLSWVSILLKNNESCVSNGGNTTKYFPLMRGARQGDPISAYLFIIVLEVFFAMIRSNNNIKGIHILDFYFLITAYADDSTFFVADMQSINMIFSTFDVFAQYSGMEINRSKCELAGIGSKMNVPTSLDGIKNVSLITDSIRVLGVHFTYSTKLSIDRNFTECIKKLQNIIRVWGMRSLTLYGKVTIFKTLALSKVICIASMSNIPNDIVKLIEQIHLDFIWSNKRPNIKHSTLIGDYAKGGLKDVDIPAKMKALHLSWINRLFDSNSRPWKLIPLYHINKVSSDTIFFSSKSLH